MPHPPTPEKMAAPASSASVTLSIDAMSGDRGPGVVIDGLARLFSRQTPAPEDVRAIAHGDAAQLNALLARRPQLEGRVEVRHADAVVPMNARPREALRQGRASSMQRALDCVADGEATIAVSAGNTAALMTLATLRLRPAPGVDRPAIAALWPSLGPTRWCVALDMGADLRAGPENLLQFGLMGAEYARLALGLEAPRVALLNVGVEDTKGRPELRQAAELLRAALGEAESGARYVGFVEADRIAFDEADVVVTDGFTGNVALKSAEGAARLIGAYLREAFGVAWWRRVTGLAAYPALRALKARMDPSKVNGGVFLGLNGGVVKSHGSADAVGFEAALALAARLGARRAGPDGAEDLATSVARRIARQLALAERAAHSRRPGATGDFAAGSG